MNTELKPTVEEMRDAFEAWHSLVFKGAPLSVWNNAEGYADELDCALWIGFSGAFLLASKVKS